MRASIPETTLEKFTTFGDLLRFLRRKAGLTQMDLAFAVGYSDAQISRLEQNLRLPDIPTVEARFIPALDLEDEPKAAARLLDLAANVRREDAPRLGLCPYKGLSYFDEADADLFVGREVLITSLVEGILSLASKEPPPKVRTLAVVGASGSGKSSLVRAGLIPALRWNKASADWDIRLLTPTAHPLESLAFCLAQEDSPVNAIAKLLDDLAADPRSLHLFGAREMKASNNSRILLVVDQFEELFALCRSEEERVAFINNLLTAASETEGPIIVLITLRADFYAHCAAYAPLREALAYRQEYIGAMNDAELRRAIEEPARRGRWEFEPGLVELLLHDVGHEPGALPLLSHALMETWQRRRGRTMTLSGYTSSGGVRGAIAETAEAVFTDHFSQEQKAIARRIFLRLTEFGDETTPGDTRRRATFNELIVKPQEKDQTQNVLKALADARLITTSENTAEVAHEALIREWPTLRGWLEDNRESLRLHRHLTEAAQEWVARNREADALYRGARLAQASEWSASHPDELNTLECEFMEASQALAECEANQREAQRQRELEAAQRLAEAEGRRAEEQAQAAAQLRKRSFYLAGAFVMVFITALAAGYFSLQARNASRLSSTRELAAASLSKLDQDPELSLLLALQAAEGSYKREGKVLREAEEALHSSLLAHRLLLSVPHGGALAVSPDGTQITTGGKDGMIKIWDASTGEELRSITAHAGRISGLAYSPDGQRIFSGSIDGTAKLWEAASGQRLLSISSSEGPIYSIAYSPDGERLAAGMEEMIMTWDANTGKEISRFTDVYRCGAIQAIEFTQDSSKIGATLGNGCTVVLDSLTGQSLLFDRDAMGAEIDGVAFTPAGNRLAVPLPNGHAKVRYLPTTTGTVYFYGHTGQITDLKFSPDGQFLATGSEDGTARVWDASSGEQLMVLAGHRQRINQLSFFPDGQRLATTSEDGTTRVWDITPGGSHEWLTVSDPSNPAQSVSFSQDGRYMAINGFFRSNIRDAETGAVISVLEIGRTYHSTPELSPDPNLVASTYEEQSPALHATSTGKVVRLFNGHTDVVDTLAFSPDGTLFSSGDRGGEIKLWDVSTGKEVASLVSHAGKILDLEFSPDGSLLASSSEDGRVILWELAAKQPFRILTENEPSVVSLSFSPDGKRLVTSGEDGNARIWDTTDGKLLLTLKGHTGAITGVDYSPDGKQVATASIDSIARLWDAISGEELLALKGDTSGLLSVAFHPDGKRLATTSKDGTVRIYALDVGDLLAMAYQRLTRSLTTEECQQYLHIATCPPG